MSLELDIQEFLGRLFAIYKVAGYERDLERLTQAIKIAGYGDSLPNDAMVANIIKDTLEA